MITIHQIIGLAVLGLIGCFYGFGHVAARHVDSKKKELADARVCTYAPMISEKILTEEGLRWATRRNIAVALALLIATGYGTYMSIFRDWVSAP